MKYLMAFFVCCYLLVCATVFAAPAIPQVPQEGIYIVDCANVVTPTTIDTINVWGKNLYNNQKVKVFVVTVDTLKGMSIKDYASKLIKKWTTQDSTLKDSVVIVYADKEKEAYIEPGDGVSRLNSPAHPRRKGWHSSWRFNEPSFAEAIVKKEIQPALQAGRCDDALKAGHDKVGKWLYEHSDKDNHIIKVMLGITMLIFICFAIYYVCVQSYEKAVSTFIVGFVICCAGYFFL